MPAHYRDDVTLPAPKTIRLPAEVNSMFRDRRFNYEKGTLREEDVAADPFVQFARWFEEAVASEKLVEPYAMTVASVAADGAPSARIVLLRGYDSHGFVFFTNYHSRKGRELEATGKASLLFYWGELERQIRIDGSAVRVSPSESDEYFALRPRGHRLSAWASQQSAPVAGRGILEEQMRIAGERFAGSDVARPPYWGGYRVVPSAFEFWQGRPDRVHDRLAFSRVDDGWRIERLSP